MKCKIKMSTFCVYDELEYLKVHTNLYVSQVLQKAHSARKTLYISSLNNYNHRLTKFVLGASEMFSSQITESNGIIVSTCSIYIN